MNTVNDRVLPGHANRILNGVLDKMIRLLIILPLILCALFGFLVCLPIWLVGRCRGKTKKIV